MMKMKPRISRFYFVSLTVIIGLGVVLWYRFYYDPQVAILRAMPKGHDLACRVDADVDGDDRQEIVFTSGVHISEPPVETKGFPATIIVLKWQGWRWNRVWSFSDPLYFSSECTVPDTIGDEKKSLKVEDINGDGRKEIIFRSVHCGADDTWNYFHLFGYRKGRYVSLLTTKLWHNEQGGVVVKDLDPQRQGKEILCWTFLWKDYETESHASPHRYYATLLAWDGSHYKPYKWVETVKKFEWDDKAVLRALLDPSAVIVRAKPRSEKEIP